MARGLFIAGVVAVFFWIYTIVDVSLTDASRARGVSKGAWIVLVVLLPVIGGILWLTIGKDRHGRSTVRRPLAPDDDPAFLGRIGEDEERRERIRRLEQELADLDDESKDP